MYLRFAAKAGIKLMTFDDEIELHKVKELYPSAELVLRILVDDSAACCSVSITKTNLVLWRNISWNRKCSMHIDVVLPGI